MRCGEALAVLAALTLALTASGVEATGGQLLLGGDGYRVGQPGLVHAVVDPPNGTARVQADVAVAVEGPDGTTRLERETSLPEGGPRLVTLGWTPDEPGVHTLSGRARLDGAGFDLGERTVEVQPAAGPQPRAPGPDPGAPGAIQWAIVFGALYLATRESFRRSGA